MSSPSFPILDFQTQPLSLTRITLVPSPALASSCWSLSTEPGRLQGEALSAEPCSERRCQRCLCALTHCTASPGQRLPGHPGAMRVALPPRAAKAWITAATCPCAAGDTAGTGAGLGWGLRRCLVGTAQRGEGLNLRGLGTVRLGCPTSGWTEPRMEGRVEEGAPDGEAREEPGRYRDAHGRKVHGASGCGQGVMVGSDRILCLPSAPLCGAPRRAWPGTEGHPKPGAGVTALLLPSLHTGVSPLPRAAGGQPGGAAQLCMAPRTPHHLPGPPHPASPASLPASRPASRPACRIPPLRGRRPVI